MNRNFSFSLYDVEQRGIVSKEDMIKVLTAMNRTASWFGDPCLTKDTIEALVNDIFASHPDGLDYK